MAGTKKAASKQANPAKKATAKKAATTKKSSPNQAATKKAATTKKASPNKAATTKKTSPKKAAPKKAATTKKATTKKAPAKKAVTKKTSPKKAATPKKTSPKKAATKKTSPKKAVTKKTSPKKAATKKAPAKKAVTKKTSPKKAAPKKAATAKKAMKTAGVGATALSPSPTTPATASPDATPANKKWPHQWKELYEEVITSGLCTGCSGCVITCPYDVIGYEHSEGKYLPFHLEDELGPSNCVHGEGGCTMCTRACPRFRQWEPQANEHLFGRDREPDEMSGIWRQLYLTRASDEMVHKMGQDGGFVSAMLIWLREHDYIDAALVSGVEDDDKWKAKPRVVSTREEILDTAGSRYTYCANPLALDEAREAGHDRLALVGMGCQVSSPPTMWARKAGKVSKPIQFNIGLLCSKTFDDSIFPELFEAKYGLAKADMVKMNIKGVFQVWMKDGSYHEIDLKETHAWTRQGCVHCPDFSAEHADISTGGIGEDNDWTLTVVRTELGEEVINRMIADGSIITKPAQEDATAMRLLKLLSIVSRRRWPTQADAAPAVGVPPPKKKAPAPAAT